MCACSAPISPKNPNISPDFANILTLCAIHILNSCIWICKPSDIFSIVSIHAYPPSPNISSHIHAPYQHPSGYSMLSTYKIFAEPSQTFGHQCSWFYSICNALIYISKCFYCARMHICTFFSLHSSPSIQHLLPTSIKFSIDFGSIIKHSYFPPPFSKINWCLVLFNFFFLIYNLFLSPLVFLPFSSYFFCVSCFGSSYFHSYLLDYLFRIFSNFCTLMYL